MWDGNNLGSVTEEAVANSPPGDFGPVIFVVTNSNSLDFLVCVFFIAAVLNFHQKKVSNKVSWDQSFFKKKKTTTTRTINICIIDVFIYVCMYACLVPQKDLRGWVWDLLFRHTGAVQPPVLHSLGYASGITWLPKEAPWVPGGSLSNTEGQLIPLNSIEGV